MIDHINSTRAAHIMTVEDPIEYLHRDYQSIVSQREVAVDTASFSHALRSALRQDPDVILVGEMRDFETVETALLAAETGHLVFSTLHTLDATETINRIISVFPPHQQRQIRIQLSTVLKAAVSQRLMPRADGLGRVPAVEVMIATPFIRDCILDKDETNQIHGAIASGTSQYGMQTFDQSIFSLYQQGFVTLEEAMRWASNVDEFKLKVQGISTTAEQAQRRDGQAGRRPAGHHPVWGLNAGRPRSAYVDALHLLVPARAHGRRVPRPPARPRASRRQRSTPPSHASSRPAASTTRGSPQAYARTAGEIKGRGRLRVVRELQARGVDKEVAAEAVGRGLRREGRTRARRPRARRRSCAAGRDPPTRPNRRASIST